MKTTEVMQNKSILTLRPPHGLHHLHLHHEDDGSYDDGRQCRLGYVVEIGGEEE